MRSWRIRILDMIRAMSHIDKLSPKYMKLRLRSRSRYGLESTLDRWLECSGLEQCEESSLAHLIYRCKMNSGTLGA
jgi:hypothetical protein